MPQSWRGERAFPAEEEAFTSAFAEAVQELAVQHHDRFELTMSIGETICMVAYLQLALRHPVIQQDGVTGQNIHNILAALVTALGQDFPIIEAGLRRGFDPQQDQPQQGG